MIKKTQYSFLFPLDFCFVNLKSAIRNAQCAILVGALFFALWLPAEAQQPAKIPRIGMLVGGSVSSYKSRIDAFRQGLRELGYVDGKNILIEYRYAEGKPNRYLDLAADLVRLKVDVIVVGGTMATAAAKNATKVIPIVMTIVSDPVALGFVDSLARPGGSITGSTVLAPELGGKRLELLREAVPRVSRLAVLGTRDAQSYGGQMKEIEVAARAWGLQPQPVEVQRPDDLDNAFSVMTKGGAGALIMLQSPLFPSERARIADLAAKSRLPAMYPQREFVDAGGLMSYGPDYADLYRRAAIYVDKILKGSNPAELPVEQPTKFELVINLKAAKQIGLTIPPNLLARADKVIK